MPESHALPLEISTREVQQLRQQGADLLLMDCREADEYDIARIDGAMLVPLSELRHRVAELEPHCNRRIIVHCHHGGRSLQVAEALRQHGFEKIQSMAGGIDEWSQEVDPSIPRY